MFEDLLGTDGQRHGFSTFSDREAIFRATAEQASQAFYGMLAEELATAASLQEQVERAAVFFCRSKEWVPLWGEAFDAERVALLTTTPVTSPCPMRAG